MDKNHLNLEIKDSIFDPELPTTISKVHVLQKNGERPRYKVWLYLEGNDLPFVESVTYTLHESFAVPNRTVRRTPSNPNCQLAFYTWGLFKVKATIVDKKGFTYTVAHELTYDKELPQDGGMYVYERDDPKPSERPTLVVS